MNFHFSDHLILRTPVFFSASDYQADTDEFLSRPILQAGVYLASPGFYQRLAAAGFKTRSLSSREKSTLQKYLNRACLRPTPFGLFAGVSLVSWQRNSRIVIGTELTAVVEPDQEIVQQIYALTTAAFRKESHYLANPYLYRVLNEFRFVRSDIGADSVRQYQLQSTQYSRVLEALLQFCRRGRTGVAIIERIGKLAGCDLIEAADYASFLADTQILLPERRPVLTGQMATHQQVLGRSSLTPQYFTQRAAKFRKIADANMMKEEHTSYVILQHNLSSAGMDPVWQDRIRQGVFALDRLCPPDELPAMNKFCRAFQQHFEGQRIPLLTALDPESGIGYQDPVSEVANPLLETLHLFSRLSEATSAWTKAHVYLMERWIMAERNQTPVIRLETEGLEKIQKEEGFHQPLGISILFRTTGEQVWLESAGGNNALSLAGRFTIGNAAINSAAQGIASQLEAQNPDVLFAEILHFSDPHTDNVNRRESLWSFELPVTASSGFPVTQQLQLSDLYLEMHQGMVFLWSEKHQKLVIPRLSSAYNHHLNKLPLFRFLADLSYQYGRCNLSFDLRAFFPGLHHYPRVAYQQAILCPATWVLSAEKLRPVKEAAEGSVFQAFQELVSTCGLPSRFVVAEGDQQLVFYTNRVTDAVFFAEVIRQKKEIIILEHFEPDITVASDQEGKACVTQFNAMLLPDEPLQLPPIRPAIREKNVLPRKFMPGSEWLYLKIYLPRTSASKLLLRIRPLIRKKYANGKVSKWFFIRYEDHAPHIRLRMKVDPLDISEVLIAFRRSLEGHIRQQVIRDYQVDVYSREMERYQAAGITLTENHFEASSNFVLEYLREGKDAPPVHLAAMVSLQSITAILIPDTDDQLTFYRESYEGLLLEFEGSAMRRELDQKYRELSGGIYAALHSPDLFKGKVLVAAFIGLELSMQPIKASLSSNPQLTIDYLRSLIHMHLNRLFTDQQRKQEMVIYFLLFKFALSKAGRRKNQAT